MAENSNILVYPFSVDQWKHYVLGFMFSDNRKLVHLIKKNKPDFQKDLLNGIGGKVEPNDLDINSAMTREFFEETGVAVNPQDWTYYHTLNVPSLQISVYCFYYISRSIREFISCKTMTAEEVVTLAVKYALTESHIIPNLKWLIPMALDDTHVRSQSENKF